MKILVLTGAGFCYPLGLPMTSGFKQEIDKIPNDLKYFLDNHLKDSKEDIEKVLSALEEFTKESSLLNFILNDRAKTNPGSYYSRVTDDLKTFRGTAVTHITNIKRSLYKHLNKFKLEDATNLYGSVLMELKDLYENLSLSIFTTNYDLTFEKFLFNQGDFLKNKLGVENVEFGFSLKYGMNVFDSTNKYDWEANVIEYQKLHGSLDWVRDTSSALCMKSGASISPAQPNDTPMLYPGYKDTPSIEPFISMHDNLSKKLFTAELIIVIGFAFRDNYINTLFESFLKSNNNNVDVLCFNPCSPNDLPIDSKINYFSQHYESFMHIEKGIDLKEYPLGLKQYIHK